MKIRGDEPRVHQAFQISADIVVDEQQVRPHILAARLSFIEIKFVPKWSRLEAIQPRWVKQHEEKENGCKSDVSINDCFNQNPEVLDFVLVHVCQKHDAVQKATDEEERLHEIPAVDNEHWPEPVVTLKMHIN